MQQEGKQLRRGGEKLRDVGGSRGKEKKVKRTGAGFREGGKGRKRSFFLGGGGWGRCTYRGRKKKCKNLKRKRSGAPPKSKSRSSFRVGGGGGGFLESRESKN